MLSKRRQKILIFSRYFSPLTSSGGPAKSLKLLVLLLSQRYDVNIISGLSEFGSKSRHRDLEFFKWYKNDNYQIYYLPGNYSRILTLRKLVNRINPKTIYFNSFWDFHFTILPIISLISCSHVKLLAPRGEFSEGALDLKRLRKHVYLTFARYSGLYKKVKFHATSENELADIKKYFKNNKVYKIGNLVDDVVPYTNLRNVRGSGHLSIVFVSRITKMKNLLFALKVLSSLDIPILFSVFGPIQDDPYWKLCLEAASKLPENVVFEYFGALDQSDVPLELAKHDLLFLPTLGENFGHVIVEAISVGTPVLISDQTPWNDLEKHGVGWALSLDQPDGFKRAILKFFDESFDDHERRRKNCRIYKEKRLSNSQFEDDYLKLFGA